MNTGNQFLGTERISKLMRQYAVPCIISLLVGALYNIVDQIFIANASYLGSYGNAANTVVFPLTAAYLIFADNIVAMFGGTVNEETFRHSQEYFFYITLGIPFYMFGQAMNPVIRADGSPKFAMVSTLAGAAVNIILDPVFIFGFQWGMMGAAVATVIGQVITAILAVWYLLNMKIIKPAKGDYVLQGSVCGRTLILGVTSFLSQISLVAAMAAGCIFLQAVGKALSSTLLSMFREVVFGVGFALLLPVFFGLDGVLYSMPVSDILTFLISAVIIAKTYRDLNTEGVQRV